jgi:hypothetical protein
MLKLNGDYVNKLKHRVRAFLEAQGRVEDPDIMTFTGE